MAIELGEAFLFIIVGLAVGIAIVFVVMQSRVTKKAQMIFEQRRSELESHFEERKKFSDSMHDQRKQELETLIEQRKQELDSQIRGQVTAEFETWKAEYVIQHDNEVEERIKAQVTRSVNSSRSSLKGKINEQIAPLFPEFTAKYVAADARFLGSPVDFIVFKNLHTFSSGSEIDPQPLEIVFVEVKTGKSSLTPNERAVKTAVENLRVKYDLLKISVDDGSSSNPIELGQDP